MSAPSGRVLRVFLLDDHDLVRRGVRDLLSAARDVMVVGESSDARPAARQILALDVDVMVLDLHLQDGTGVSVCRKVRSADPRVRGLLLTAATDDEATLAAVLAGAAGFSTKFARSADLLGTIRAIGSDASLIDAAVAERVRAAYLRRLDDLRPPLSHEDRELLGHVADGLTDAELAQRMGLDEEPLHDRVAALIERTL
ncbi:MAG TPA: response regulator transcription factor [Nocardioidaceae bacterium]|nr:response regulator transcription factor [Nocardioidaceae bacterium]